MANEIKLVFSLTASKGGVAVSRNPATASLTWTGGTYAAQTASIGTTYEALPAAADLGTAGLMWLFNPSTAAAAVAISFDDGTTAHLTVKGGEWQLFRLASAITPGLIKMKSLGAGAVTIEYVILSD